MAMVQQQDRWAVLKALDDSPWKTRISEPRENGFSRWRGGEAARRALTNNRVLDIAKPVGQIVVFHD